MYLYDLMILANDRFPLARGFWTGSATESELGNLPFPKAETHRKCGRSQTKNKKVKSKQKL